MAEAACSPGSQQTEPGVIQPLARAWPRGSPTQRGSSPSSPPSPDELPANVKQAYRAFAAVPSPHPPEDGPAQPPAPGTLASPEQLSFRERQKYFELELRMPQAEGPPKRVSLVGADDLRKMQEEEARKLQRKRAQMLREEAAAGLALDAEAPEEEPEPEDEPPWAGPGPTGGPSPTGPAALGGGGAPVRTAKAERRQQERLRMQSPELGEPPAPERALSPAERRALEAEKRALWRAARMKSLEQDALRAQMVLSRSQDGRGKRGPLERLAEAPSPAPTPSPTPPEDLGPQRSPAPGRLSPGLEELSCLEPSPSPSPQEEDGEVALVLLGRAPAGAEDTTPCSGRRPLRPGRRGLGPVPS